MLVVASVTSARYLPTRSDNSRRERIKDVLRMLLELSDSEISNMSNGYGSMYPGREGPFDSFGTENKPVVKRSVQLEQAVPVHL